MAKTWIGFAEPLRAGLKNAAIPAGGLDDHLPLRDGEAGRFFAIDVLAGAHGHRRRQRVPTVAGGGQHGIHIRPLGEELADVTVEGAVLVAVLAVHDVLGRFAPILADIADGNHLHI